ncbi:MAG: hypothetical protein NVSMB66_6340 [Candidatus Doudnabacteria bacterium]
MNVTQEQSDNTENGEKTVRDPETGRFVEGTLPGPGRPLGMQNKDKTPISDAIREILKSERKSKLKTVTRGEELARSMVEKSLKDSSMAKIVMEYTEGKPKQVLEVDTTLTSVTDEKVKELMPEFLLWLKNKI